MTVEPETDGTLIERSARGRPDAFVDVVRRHELAVLHAARESLWSAVAQEMLTTTPSPQAPTRRAAAANSQGLDGTLDPLEGDRWHIDP